MRPSVFTASEAHVESMFMQKLHPYVTHDWAQSKFSIQASFVSNPRYLIGLHDVILPVAVGEEIAFQVFEG